MNKNVLVDPETITHPDAASDGADCASLVQTWFHADDAEFHGMALSELEIGEFEGAPPDWV
jgi:hypothetical protein